MDQKVTTLWRNPRRAPILVGVFPFGLIYGALARNAGLPRCPRK